MSLDQRIGEALATYAEEVEMTTSDVDRMQHQLHDRLEHRRRPGRRPVLVAAVAALLLLAAVVAGTAWLRRPDTSVPATPQGFGPVPAVFLSEDRLGRFLGIVQTDGTYLNYENVGELIHPLVLRNRLGWQVVGDQIVIVSTDEQGQQCRQSARFHVEEEGKILRAPATLEGPGCQFTSASEVTSVRLSPVSEAGRQLTPTSRTTPSPVTDPVQLNGIWLLRGTGVVLAAHEQTNSGSGYLLDDDGDIDVAPDAKGSLAVSPDGRITLASTDCAETVLDNAKITGMASLSALTVTVASDPCNRFSRETVLTWIKVLM
jgi:hypothetical protein